MCPDGGVGEPGEVGRLVLRPVLVIPEADRPAGVGRCADQLARLSLHPPAQRVPALHRTAQVCAAQTVAAIMSIIITLNLFIVMIII